VVIPFFVVISLFATILALMEVGRARCGAAEEIRMPRGANAGLGTVDGAVFGLMGLLVAFHLLRSSLPFRRAETINWAGSKCPLAQPTCEIDLLPSNLQPALRDHFRNYGRCPACLFQEPAARR